MKNGSKVDTFSWIQKIPEMIFANLDTPITRYGRFIEPMSAETFLFTLKKLHTNVRKFSCGLFLDTDVPFIGYFQ